MDWRGVLALTGIRPRVTTSTNTSSSSSSSSNRSGYFREQNDA